MFDEFIGQAEFFYQPEYTFRLGEAEVMDSDHA